ncbi:MAG: carboxypeptidase-like regulatory domain-containing protein, partial [Bacteroidota bacterium]
MIRITTLLLLAAVFSTSTLYAQDQGRLTGKVTDIQGESLPGIAVMLQGSSQGAATQIDGRYKLTNIAPGRHKIVVSGVGLASQEVSVSIQAGQTTQQDFVMQQDATQMEEVVIQAESEAE